MGSLRRLKADYLEKVNKLKVHLLKMQKELEDPEKSEQEKFYINEICGELRYKIRTLNSKYRRERKALKHHR